MNSTDCVGIKPFTSVFSCRGPSVNASIILVVPPVIAAVHCTISFHGVLVRHLMGHSVNHASVMDMPPAVVIMILLQLLT